MRHFYTNGRTNSVSGLRENVFLHLFNMSITAGWLVLAVVVLRLLLKKAPKWLTCLLWGLVGVRLVCPVSVQSFLSLIPSAQTVSPDIMMDPTPQITMRRIHM